MPVVVPNVIGLTRAVAEATLDSLLLRHVAQFPFGPSTTGAASQQSPVAGTTVAQYSVVTVTYPTALDPMPDTPVQGPIPPDGIYEGKIKGLLVGNQFGTGVGAWMNFAIPLDGATADFMLTLYFDQTTAAPSPQVEWMRRAAMLGLAQRAFTNNGNVRAMITGDTSGSIFVVWIEIF
jgi:hypothetical protein